jgi:hypothetical protein
MSEIGFNLCLAAPDVWLRPAVKADDTKYYEYVIVFTDDILAISEKPREILDMIDKANKVKPKVGTSAYDKFGCDHFEVSVSGWTRSMGDAFRCLCKRSDQELKERRWGIKSESSSTLTRYISLLLLDEKAT